MSLHAALFQGGSDEVISVPVYGKHWRANRSMPSRQVRKRGSRRINHALGARLPLATIVKSTSAMRQARIKAAGVRRPTSVRRWAPATRVHFVSLLVFTTLHQPSIGHVSASAGDTKYVKDCEVPAIRTEKEGGWKEASLVLGLDHRSQLSTSMSLPQHHRK